MEKLGTLIENMNESINILILLEEHHSYNELSFCHMMKVSMENGGFDIKNKIDGEFYYAFTETIEKNYKLLLKENGQKMKNV